MQPYGAPNFYRILDYVRVPSRYVGTDTMLNAETFNDVPGVVGYHRQGHSRTAAIRDICFQPPFNKVSRQRDPGRVNLNTVTGRRIDATATTPALIWSEVFDGIMHRGKNPLTGAGDDNIRDSLGNVIHLGNSVPRGAMSCSAGAVMHNSTQTIR